MSTVDRPVRHRAVETVVGLLAVLTVACAQTDHRPGTASGEGGPTMPATVAGAHAAEAPAPQPQPQAPEVDVPWTPGEWHPPPDGLEPVGIWIPTLDVAAPMQRLGLNEDRTLQVPADWDVTGWYEGRSRPGEPGPAVIAGHVDSRTGPAVFHRLGELERGDLVHVVFEDHLVETFVVAGTERHAKTGFPTRRVYGPTDGPTIRLITCAGPFDRQEGSYEDNLIVYGQVYATWRYDPAGA